MGTFTATGAFVGLAGGPVGAAIGGLLGAVAGPAVQITRKTLGDLEKNNFGICKGLRASGSTAPALTEWIYESLQYIAFGKADHPRPLTFGDLERAGNDGRGVKLRMVTSNLSMRRPHFLPWVGVRMGYKREEWAEYFPAPVMDFLDTLSKDPIDASRPDIAKWVSPHDMPVVVATRLSLSFPILLSAVPAYVVDQAERERYEELVQTGQFKAQVKRCLLSDGGICSNFPIHFFDQPLPRRPTFAISLDPLQDDWKPKVQRRAYMFRDLNKGEALPVWPFKGVAGFLLAIVNTAKDWQDSIQSTLPGFRDRIVRVALSREEGGLNLAMPPATVAKLLKYGEEAGAAALGFEFTEHQWARAASSYQAFNDQSKAMKDAWPELRAVVVNYGPTANSFKEMRPYIPKMTIDYDAWHAVHKDIAPLPDRRDYPDPNVRLRIQIDT
jgi:hypothetical protein